MHQVLTFTRRHNETETTYARRFNTYILGELIIFKKYGRTYLSEQEYNEMLRKKIKEYYRYLFENYFLRERKEIWDYHKKGLKELGFSISYVKLFKVPLIAVLNRFLDVFRIKKQGFLEKDIKPKTPR